jgi:ABC-type iron transport system FetAB permease component
VDFPIVKALNFASAALVPAAAGFVAAMIFGFASMTLAIMLIGVTSLTSAAFLYAEIQNNREFRFSPLWLFLALQAVYNLLMWFILDVIFEISGMLIVIRNFIPLFFR